MKKKHFLILSIALILFPVISFAQTADQPKKNNSSFTDIVKSSKVIPNKKASQTHVTQANRRTKITTYKPSSGFQMNWDNGIDTWYYSNNFRTLFDTSKREIMREDMDTAGMGYKNKQVTMYNKNGNEISVRSYSSPDPDSAYVFSSLDSTEYHPTYPTLETFQGSFNWDDFNQTLNLNWGDRSTYDIQSGQILGCTDEGFYGMNWETNTLKTYHYNNGLLTESISFNIQNNTDTTGGEKEVYEYDANNIPVSVTTSTWNTTTKVWELSTKMDSLAFNNYHGSLVDFIILNSIDLEEIQITRTVYLEWNGSAWEFTGKEENSFSGDTAINTVSHWDNITNQWTPAERHTSFNKDTISFYENEQYDSIKFVKTERYQYRYDNQGNFLEFKYETWTDSLNAYTIQSWNRNLLNFDSEGRLLDETEQHWETSTLAFKNSVKKVYLEWQMFEEGDDNNTGASPIKSNAAITVYPNPVSDYANIKFDESILGHKQIIVRDLSGRIVEQLNTNTNTLSFPLNNYPSGIYFINIVSEQTNTVVKLVKE
ncbi:MAG: T9SS type A sorting domain-containing protein [Bacteroidia bacterium]|nr:T9SS type A sorting domain-containing protein [Bacteroidia bacterium]